jgi:hypothetical protein
MHLSNVLLGAGLAAAHVIQRQETKGCTNPVKRVEFRSLDNAARKQYTDAVKCLATKPSKLGLNTYVHTQLSNESTYLGSKPQHILKKKETLPDHLFQYTISPSSCPGTGTSHGFTRSNSVLVDILAPWCKPPRALQTH